MKKLLILILVFVLLMPVLTASLQARSTACQYARFHPGLAYQCFIEIMMDLWNPLDWGDSGSLSTVRGDGDDLGGYR
jgi:hypothetical protein